MQPDSRSARFAVMLAFAAMMLAFLPHTVSANEGKTRIIVLDPGHGGEDSGAIGHRNFEEKYIVLNFTLRLKEQLQRRNPDFKVYLTRKDDEMVPLATRIGMARRLKADLLISLHADWSADPSVSGFAAYSAESGAAKAYNARKPDRYMRAVLPGKAKHPQAVSAILHDLVSRESRHQSGFYARKILASVGAATPLLDRAHRLARFHVLTAPEVPAVLLELGFLTNAEDAVNLTRASWQIEMAERIAAAVDESFRRPAGEALIY